MIFWKRTVPATLFLLGICGLLNTITAQTIDPSLLQKAQSLGLSTSDIEALTNSTQLQQLQQSLSSQQNNNISSQAINNSLLMNNMMGLGIDSSKRWNMTQEELDRINPSQLEKLISNKIDQEGQIRDVRSSMTSNSVTPNMLNSGSLTQDASNFLNAQEIPYEKPVPIEYEIVIKNGQYIKRALPVVFGREVFSSKNLTFAPNYNMPTPPNYVLGPDDELIVEVWGSSEMHSKQKITPDGTITIQGIGPISVVGLTMQEANQRISSRIVQIMEGAQVNVSLGEIRSITVNLAGEVMVPGTYTLPSLATVFNAVYAAGGVNRIGSLRSIKVYRNSQQIADLDVYDYLIYGRYETNIRLEDNDMIIVSPYENYVTLTGKIKRERVYELKKGETLKNAIEYAGGFTGDAYSENLNIFRKTGRQHSIQTVDQADFDSFVMYDGDSVVVDKIIADYANRLTITGAVWRPGDYQLSENLSTLSQLIAKAEGLRGDEFASRGQITRRKPDFTYEIIPFDVRAAATGTIDIPLQKEDLVYIPNILELRENYQIIVKGEVNRPDTLPYYEGMTVEDAIIRSGGLKESASYANIEIARRIKDPNSTTYTNRTADIHTFSITGDLAIAPEANRFTLMPFDEIYIRRSPGYREQQSVTVSGEVLYAGDYVLATAGERLSDVIRKAGGVTPEAYVRGASIKRMMTDSEKAKVDAMLRMARNEENAVSEEDLQIDSVYPIGVDIEQALLNPGCSDDIILRDGDQILIPKYNSTVKISGSVLYPNTTTFDKPKLKSYISQAGGYRDGARRRPFVIYMNGKVAATRTGFFCKNYPKVEPGCEIVVPVKQKKATNTLGQVMGMVSSTTSLAAMIASLVNLTK